eukprot:15484420-Alexandrium_andersonii.AAC.1
MCKGGPTSPRQIVPPGPLKNRLQMSAVLLSTKTVLNSNHGAMKLRPMSPCQRALAHSVAPIGRDREGGPMILAGVDRICEQTGAVCMHVGSFHSPMFWAALIAELSTAPYAMLSLRVPDATVPLDVPSTTK